MAQKLIALIPPSLVKKDKIGTFNPLFVQLQCARFKLCTFQGLNEYMRNAKN